MHHFLVRYLAIGALISCVQSKTDSSDVVALNGMFKRLNTPSQLSGWGANGGDPCGNSWEGITCSGSSVTEIKLSGYGLNGQLGYELSSLTSVTSFDLSKNNLNGEIPYQLPPNAVHINLSQNQFTGTVPYSISLMTNLQDLNLSHNQLKGELSDTYAELQKLKSLDLSFNKLSNRLPNTFANLTSIETMHLQNNQFTGSINVLADLPLKDLNVQNNKFTGWIPNELKNIDKLETGGNSWSNGRAPPPPPGVNHRHPNKGEGEGNQSSGGNKSVVSTVIIVVSCIVALMVITLIIVVITRRRAPPPTSHFLDEERMSGNKRFTPRESRDSSPESQGILKGSKDFNSNSIDVKSLQKSPSKGVKRSISGTGRVSFSDNDFASRLKGRRSTSVRVTPFTLTDLQHATGNFASNRLLGVGTIGRVYKAKYPDGKVLAVKKIGPSLFQGENPEAFSELVTNISKLHHPNITELVGYCSEPGHNMLVYDYYRNGSLYDFLHVSDDFSKPLTWNTRIRIALGAARAVEYLHDVRSPPIIHKNIKSSNVLLDLELNAHLSDYGLATFHQRTSQNLGMGYNAPECTRPSAYTLKSDVYSYGVVMLELLTGRMPVDSKRPKPEECLVKWATPQLHDIDALSRMVDPALRGLYPLKSLPPFADIIALCVQPDPKLRAPIAEVVKALVRFVQQLNVYMKEDLSTSRRTEDSDY